MVLRREPPKFFQFQNYLQDYGWPGFEDSLVERLRSDVHDERIRHDWSIIEKDGVSLIRCRRTKHGDGADLCDYSYFDPAKGCMLVRKEWPSRDGEKGLECTWKLEEVSPGVWFPVEMNQSPARITTGDESFEFTIHITVDLQESCFNDRSAFPDGIFRLEITKDIVKVYDLRFGAGDTPLTYGSSEIEPIIRADLDKMVDRISREQVTPLESGTSPATTGERVLHVDSNTGKDKPSRKSRREGGLAESQGYFLPCIVVCLGIGILVVGFASRSRNR